VPGSGIPFGLLESGQVADEEDDVAGVDVGADGPVGLASVEECGQRRADRAEAVRGEVVRYRPFDGGEDAAPVSFSISERRRGASSPGR
jgi:hypothetical protein